MKLAIAIVAAVSLCAQTPDAPKKKVYSQGQRNFWSFKSIKDIAPPMATPSPIDAFILAKLNEKGLKPANPASKLALIRRATFDLTGLPPTEQETVAFLADNSPSAFANVLNIYQPAQGAVVGALAVGNFANPISFLCGAIQAASRLGAEQSAKLCVQYLAPIIKNRQYNFPPIGVSPFVGAQARPNEITYSEDWLRPDYVPPAGAASGPAPAGSAPLPAEAPSPPPPKPTSTDPTAGLPGLMVPGGGS